MRRPNQAHSRPVSSATESMSRLCPGFDLGGYARGERVMPTRRGLPQTMLGVAAGRGLTVDVAALAAVTLRAARDPGLRARIGRTARARAEQYSLAQLLDAYEALLEKVAERQAGIDSP